MGSRDARFVLAGTHAPAVDLLLLSAEPDSRGYTIMPLCHAGPAQANPVTLLLIKPGQFLVNAWPIVYCCLPCRPREECKMCFALVSMRLFHAANTKLYSCSLLRLPHPASMDQACFPHTSYTPAQLSFSIAQIDILTLSIPCSCPSRYRRRCTPRQPRPRERSPRACSCWSRATASSGCVTSPMLMRLVVVDLPRPNSYYERQYIMFETLRWKSPSLTRQFIRLLIL